MKMLSTRSGNIYSMFNQQYVRAIVLLNPKGYPICYLIEMSLLLIFYHHVSYQICFFKPCISTLWTKNGIMKVSRVELYKPPLLQVSSIGAVIVISHEKDQLNKVATLPARPLIFIGRICKSWMYDLINQLMSNLGRQIHTSKNKKCKLACK